jgi:hypothetical protein
MLVTKKEDPRFRIQLKTKVECRLKEIPTKTLLNQKNQRKGYQRESFTKA